MVAVDKLEAAAAYYARGMGAPSDRDCSEPFKQAGFNGAIIRPQNSHAYVLPECCNAPANRPDAPDATLDTKCMMLGADVVYENTKPDTSTCGYCADLYGVLLESDEPLFGLSNTLSFLNTQAEAPGFFKQFLTTQIPYNNIFSTIAYGAYMYDQRHIAIIALDGTYDLEFNNLLKCNYTAVLPVLISTAPLKSCHEQNPPVAALHEHYMNAIYNTALKNLPTQGEIIVPSFLQKFAQYSALDLTQNRAIIETQFGGNGGWSGATLTNEPNSPQTIECGYENNGIDFDKCAADNALAIVSDSQSEPKVIVYKHNKDIEITDSDNVVNALLLTTKFNQVFTRPAIAMGVGIHKTYLVIAISQKQTSTTSCIDLVSTTTSPTTTTTTTVLTTTTVSTTTGGIVIPSPTSTEVTGASWPQSSPQSTSIIASLILIATFNA